MHANTKTKSESFAVDITRTFDAPRALVWKVWTEQQHLAHWFCAKDFTVDFVNIDLKVGGKWNFSMLSPKGNHHAANGVYTEIAAPERLVFTFNWDSCSCDGQPDTFTDSIITVDLSEDAGKTTVHFVHAGLPSVESRDSHNGGWTQFMENLGAYLKANA